MIELTWGQIRDPNFGAAIKKVFQSPLDFSTGLQVVTIVKQIDEEKKVANPMWDKHIDFYYKKDDKGNWAGLKEDTVEFKKQEEKDVSKIFEHKFTVGVPKLKEVNLRALKLTPMELFHIEPLIELANGPVENAAHDKTK